MKLTLTARLWHAKSISLQSSKPNPVKPDAAGVWCMCICSVRVYTVFRAAKKHESRISGILYNKCENLTCWLNCWTAAACTLFMHGKIKKHMWSQHGIQPLAWILCSLRVWSHIHSESISLNLQWQADWMLFRPNLKGLLLFMAVQLLVTVH